MLRLRIITSARRAISSAACTTPNLARIASSAAKTAHVPLPWGNIFSPAAARPMSSETKRMMRDAAAMNMTADMEIDVSQIEGLSTANVKEEVDPAGEGSLDNFEICDKTKRCLVNMGITKLFPVQIKTFNALMQGKDMVVKSRTGSGKTIAFALPVVETLLKDHDGAKGRAPRCLVLAPTRELAMQIQREISKLSTVIQTVTIYGGSSYLIQEEQLRRGVDIVVGTPGRVIDLINKGSLMVGQVKMFILDEADEMLKMGFQDDVETILQSVPEERQTNLWSATVPKWVQDLSRKYCKKKDLEMVDMVGDNTVRTAATIQHRAVAAMEEEKHAIIADLVRAYAAGGRALIFARTKMEVDQLAMSPGLRDSSKQLHGDVAQTIREKTLAEFRSGKCSVLVATDVAARGIDVPEVEVVIQASAPENEDTFVHRSGRTGRAGRSGINIVVYKPGEESEIKWVEDKVGIKFLLEGAPSPAFIMKARIKEVAEDLQNIKPKTRAAFEEMAAKLTDQLGPDAFAAALAHMAGYSRAPPVPHSMLTGRANFITIQTVMDHKDLAKCKTTAQFRATLEKAFPKAKIVFGKVVPLKNGFLSEIVATEVQNILGETWEEEREAGIADAKAAEERGEKIGIGGGAPMVASTVMPGIMVCAPASLPSLTDLMAPERGSSYGGPPRGGPPRGYAGSRHGDSGFERGYRGGDMGGGRYGGGGNAYNSRESPRGKYGGGAGYQSRGGDRYGGEGYSRSEGYSSRDRFEGGGGGYRPSPGRFGAYDSGAGGKPSGKRGNGGFAWEDNFDQ